VAAVGPNRQLGRKFQNGFLALKPHLHGGGPVGGAEEGGGGHQSCTICIWGPVVATVQASGGAQRELGTQAAGSLWEASCPQLGV
jgi:hypothetical protein